jgi:hypothetical protein
MLQICKTSQRRFSFDQFRDPGFRSKPSTDASGPEKVGGHDLARRVLDTAPTAIAHSVAGGEGCFRVPTLTWSEAYRGQR